MSITGDCRYSDQGDTGIIFKGATVRNTALLQNITNPKRDIQISLRESGATDLYNLCFKDSIRISTLKISKETLPSRYSSLTVAQIRKISSREINGDRTHEFFRSEDGNAINRSTIEYTTANAIRTRLEIQDGAITGISEKADDPIIGISSTDNEDTVIITNYSDNTQYMFILHIDTYSRIPVHAISKLYAVAPKTESEIPVNVKTTEGRILLIATEDIVDIDTISDILCQSIDQLTDSLPIGAIGISEFCITE